MAYLERSTDGGTTWDSQIRDTNASNSGTVVDNGMSLYWTGLLNAGDKVSIRFLSNSVQDNIVKLDL